MSLKSAQHICETCNKTFTTTHHLKRHINEQHLFQIFSCEHCGKSFNRKDTLKNHIAVVHEKSISYDCDECGKHFLHKVVLERHNRIEHEGLRVSCDLCQKEFKSQSSLKVHTESVH